MRKTSLYTLILALAVISLLAAVCLAHDHGKEEALSVKLMAEQVKDLAEKEICVEGTIIGACKSGCKMWIADGKYEDGDLFTLVRAKDDAFKFDTDKQGKHVVLHGYVVAKYKDYCGDAAAEGKAEPAAGTQAGSCKAPVKVEDATEGDLQEMTFFATKVEYVK